MTHQQIITKAIEQAIAGGWKQPANLTFASHDEFVVYLDGLSTPSDMKWLKFKVNELLFNHDFAKALWGEIPPIETHQELNRFNDNMDLKFRYVQGTTMWEYHLQQMVIAEDPIKYLGEHI
jgi:hypothetical protein